MKSFFKDKVIFISGGSGTCGHELTKQLIKFSPKKIIIFSRGEMSQVIMRREFKDNPVRFVIGDVRDQGAIDYAIRGVDYVFHLAALKHVGICEQQPQEAVKTNINGTLNLIHASIKHKIKKFVFMSTDKAILSSSFYGMTKAVCERVVIQANEITDETDFVCMRSGNVLGSSGSVVPLFIEMAKTKKKITVTNYEMTRFFLPVKNIIEVLIDTLIYGSGGEIFIPKMPSFYIKDLASVIMNHYMDDGEIVEVGSVVGEKVHEYLISPDELAFTNFGHYVINKSKYVGTGYESGLLSSSNIVPISKLRDMLLENKFLK